MTDVMNTYIDIFYVKFTVHANKKNTDIVNNDLKAWTSLDS